MYRSAVSITDLSLLLPGEIIFTPGLRAAAAVAAATSWAKNSNKHCTLSSPHLLLPRHNCTVLYSKPCARSPQSCICRPLGLSATNSNNTVLGFQGATITDASRLVNPVC